MKDNIFSQNSAIQGGAIHTLNMIPFLLTNLFLQNTAIFGPKISSFPVQLGLIINDGNTTRRALLLFFVDYRNTKCFRIIENKNRLNSSVSLRLSLGKQFSYNGSEDITILF